MSKKVNLKSIPDIADRTIKHFVKFNLSVAKGLRMNSINYIKTSTPSGILAPQPKTATQESLESG
ncbi:hypothetical protein TdN_13510 [Thermodesulfovibrio sp. TK110]